MFRFSLTTILIVTAFISLLAAGLTSPSSIWMQIIATTTLATLTVASLAGLAWQQAGRWFWIGFAVVGWAYIALDYYGGKNAREILLTHSAVLQLELITEASSPTTTPSGEIVLLREDGAIEVRGGPNPLFLLSSLSAKHREYRRFAYTHSTFPRSYHFQNIAHYGWSLILGCVGGAVSLWLYRKSAASAV